jgi:phosphatidylglycerol:prolipoprotein diacylglycerol transferase
MKPVLFHLGGIEVPAYLTMLMFGFFAAVLVARRDGEAVGMDRVAVVDLCILVLGIGIIGARLLAVLTDGYLGDFIHLCTDSTLVDPVDTAVRLCEQNSDCGFDYLCNLDARSSVLAKETRTMCYPPRDCLAVFKFWQGGLTFYGGVLVAIPVGVWFAKRRDLAPLAAADVIAPALMLGLSFGRIGCFLNGCCYGGATETAFGVRFPNQVIERHPTQLYECVFAFVIFVLLRYLFRRRCRGEGELFGWMLTLYGIFRVAIEIFRDDPRGAVGALSTSQLISIPLILVGALMVFRARRKSKV